jgi:hypothetical protein
MCMDIVLIRNFENRKHSIDLKSALCCGTRTETITGGPRYPLSVYLRTRFFTNEL